MERLFSVIAKEYISNMKYIISAKGVTTVDGY